MQWCNEKGPGLISLDTFLAGCYGVRVGGMGLTFFFSRAKAIWCHWQMHQKLEALMKAVGLTRERGGDDSLAVERS